MARTVRVLLTYRVGERVPIHGWYVCVPCGYRMYMWEGDAFPTCINCMRVSRSRDLPREVRGEVEAGDEFDEELVVENLELWEFLTQSPGEKPAKRKGDVHHRRD